MNNDNDTLMIEVNYTLFRKSVSRLRRQAVAAGCTLVLFIIGCLRLYYGKVAYLAYAEQSWQPLDVLVPTTLALFVLFWLFYPSVSPDDMFGPSSE